MRRMLSAPGSMARCIAKGAPEAPQGALGPLRNVSGVSWDVPGTSRAKSHPECPQVRPGLSPYHPRLPKTAYNFILVDLLTIFVTFSTFSATIFACFSESLVALRCPCNISFSLRTQSPCSKSVRNGNAAFCVEKRSPPSFRIFLNIANKFEYS